MDEKHPEKYCDPEEYLLNEVGPKFRSDGRLDAADFYTILDWKAPRAKNYHRERLKKIAGGTFTNAVKQIATALHRAANGRRRLAVLMNEWQFALPTATAILTLLYPDEFTVFDWRVCEELDIDYDRWRSHSFSDALWEHYHSFRQSVISETPPALTLREKDRFLLGRSYRKSIEADCMR